MDYSKALFVIRIAVDYIESATRKGDSFIESVHSAIEFLKESPTCWSIIEECELSEYIQSLIISESTFRQEQLLMDEILPESMKTELIDGLISNLCVSKV
ncbi:hypothetical protein SP15_177 [Bacillus phage SP-15]|uniref:Uncharacterized protein n=1 Tax=Bacillus phage SP-15 TaxID=1792032 RepID=A0A127AWF5_9CAUD|nr:hypothetical protein SP15_177 [Bacillus phage SP-15]AMM44975.1 hypothetical protein SP15_177 [Bacillus phage SP-15]